ncbi:MAG: NAD(+) synthase [Clostridiales bacterium]|jgi:NAD+ synthase (glutamine-hydrolysing)|nr:NAD(+) synthase [Clostridiales bacterium]
MKHGFIRVAATTPHIRLADCSYNAEQIINIIKIAEEKEIKLLVFSELCVTGYTCGDLFLQDILLRRAMEQVKRIAETTVDKELVTVIGFPYENRGRLYNTAAVIQRGRILGLVPKQSIPNYGEFYESRYFKQGPQEAIMVDFMGEEVYFGSRLLFECSDMPDFILGVEICDDLWIPMSPGNYHCIAGATVIANLSASNETIGKAKYRRELVKNQSKRLICGYVYSDAGEGESTTDLVFSGHSLIAENGSLLSEAEPFHNEMIINEIDLDIIKSDRRRMNTFSDQSRENYTHVKYSFSENDYKLKQYELIRRIDPSPFVPEGISERKERSRDIFTIQAMGLKARLSHIGTNRVLIGVSGGLDSTLAMLVCFEAFERMGLDKKGILAVTMPCFGTSSRTYKNAISLSESLGVELINIPIKDAVIQHFKDIGQDIDVHDITYENSQARERTQVLMDLANKHKGLMIGPGDLSELVLGFTTYNGDHMSMYGVNSSVPKTLIRSIVEWYADSTDNEKLTEVLKDILDTPISPELIPASETNEYQRTEDYIGPYELHDFFIYYVLRYGFSPEKVYRMAKEAFSHKYTGEEIVKWLQLFFSRFFANQYKRSCLPDGPKVGTVAVSPRGDLRMPSDAKAKLWLDEIKRISL